MPFSFFLFLIFFASKATFSDQFTCSIYAQCTKTAATITTTTMMLTANDVYVLTVEQKLTFVGENSLFTLTFCTH